MTLFIFTTNKDLSLDHLISGATKLGINYQVIYFSELSIEDKDICFENQQLTISSSDKILIRWPWDAKNTAKDYNFWVKILFLRFEKNICFDKKVLKDFSPFYEDKLFQAEVFNQLNLPYPQTTYYQTRKQLLENPPDFPVVLKKRISSRSKGNFVVESIKDVFAKAKPRLRRYIVQSKIEFQSDLRLVFLKGKYIGSVSRKSFLRKQNRFAVKVDRAVEVSELIIKQSEIIAKYLGADFLGIDVLIDSKNRHFFLEANLSPQFVRFKDVTGIDLGELVIKAALE